MSDRTELTPDQVAALLDGIRDLRSALGIIKAPPEPPSFGRQIVLVLVGCVLSAFASAALVAGPGLLRLENRLTTAEVTSRNHDRQLTYLETHINDNRDAVGQAMDKHLHDFHPQSFPSMGRR